MVERLIVRLALDLSSSRTVKTAIFLLVLFTVASLVPLLVPDYVMRGWIGDLLNEQLKGIEDAGEEGFMYLPFVIFLNNIRVSVLISLTYFTIIIPVFIIILNGFIIGFLPIKKVIENLISQLAGDANLSGAPLLYYSALIPHGLLELTTIILVATLISSGFKGGIRGIGERIAGRLLLAAINLVIAAMVETLVTPITMLIVLAILMA